MTDLVPEGRACHVRLHVRLQAVGQVGFDDSQKSGIEQLAGLLQGWAHLADNATVEDGVPGLDRSQPVRANLEDVAAKVDQALRGRPRDIQHFGLDGPISPAKIRAPGDLQSPQGCRDGPFRHGLEVVGIAGRQGQSVAVIWTSQDAQHQRGIAHRVGKRSAMRHRCVRTLRVHGDTPERRLEAVTAREGSRNT